MGFGAAVASGFNNYVNFNGRASRSEYWYWFLFAILLGMGVGFIAGILDVALGSQLPNHITQAVLSLVLFLPNLSMAIRRLHDLERSGWWYGGAAIIGVFMAALLIPMAIRMNENRMAGDLPMDGIPSGVGIIIAILGLIEFIYGLMLLIWFCSRGTRGGNRFGSDPLRQF